MGKTVDIAIPVEADAASALAHEPAREAIGRVVSRMLRPNTNFDPLLAVMERLSAEAAQRGLTQAILDDELKSDRDEKRNEGSLTV